MVEKKTEKGMKNAILAVAPVLSIPVTEALEAVEVISEVGAVHLHLTKPLIG